MDLRREGRFGVTDPVAHPSHAGGPRHWSAVFGGRHFAIGILAGTVLAVPQISPHAGWLAGVLLGAVLPLDVLAHLHVRRTGGVPRSIAYADQVVLCGLALAFQEAWPAVLLLALADLALMTSLFDRRVGAGAALVAIQGYSLVTVLVQPPDATVGLVAFVIAAPMVIVTVGAVADLERRVRARYQGLVRGIDAIIWEADPRTLRLTYVSPRIGEVLGLGPQVWLADPDRWISQIHPEDRDRVVKAYMTAILQNEGCQQTYRVRDAEGRDVWLRDRMTPEHDDEGTVTLLRGELTNITTQVEADREIRRYADIVEHIQTALLVWRRQGDGTLLLSAANPAAADLLGHRPEEVVGRPVVEVLPEAAAQGMLGIAEGVARTGVASSVPAFRHGSGEDARWYEVTLFPLPDRAVGLALADITTQRRAQSGLTARARQWAALAELGQCAIENFGIDDLCDTAVSLTSQVLGTRDTAVVGLSPDRASFCLRSSIGFGAQSAREPIPRGTGSELDAAFDGAEPLVVDALRAEDRFSASMLLADTRAVSGICIPIQGSDEDRDGVLVTWTDTPRRFDVQDVQFLTAVAQVLADAMDRRRAEDALAHEALHDSLTGLANRALLYDRLELALATARRSDQPVALLLMDVDGFKDVNDTLGHHFGDLLLRAMAERLSDLLRGSDTLARLGGDEFAIVLPDLEDPGAAVRVADRIEAAFAEPFRIEGISVDVSASMGIAIHPDHGDDVDTLMQRADVAMYAAKPQRGSYEIYANQDGPSSSGRLALLSDLRKALDQDELVLHYQPQVDLRTGRVCRAEALLRWHHPELGVVMPGRFIQLAETSGLIHALSERVLELAVRGCRRWMDDGLDLGVAVNISVHDLRDDRLVDHVRRLLAAYEVPAGRLTLEITESGIMDDPAKAAEVLRALAALGVRISVDDFGTGHSTFAYLKQLPINEIKIDRAFVKDLANDQTDAVIVRSLVDLSHTLQLEVVAEGVEDAATLGILLEATSCDHAQGFHVARPTDPERFLEWLEACRWLVPRSDRVA